MKKRNYRGMHTIMVLALITGFIFYMFYYANFTGFVIIETKNQTGFDEGTYLNTHWNGTYVGLNLGQLNGEYTSKVFGSNSNVTWNNVSFEVNLPIEENFTTNLSYNIRNCDQSDCSNVNWQNYASGNIGSGSKYFQYKVNFNSDSLNITPQLLNVNIDYTVLNIIANDSLSPNITLIYPYNNSGDVDGSITYNYNVTDINSISNCSLIKDASIVQTDISVNKNVVQTFDSTGLSGSHTWAIGCYDDSYNYKESETRSFSIIKLSSYISNLNLSEVNIKNVNNFYLEESNYGAINFTENLDLSSGLDIDSNVNISKNNIEIKSAILSALNKSAVLTLKKLNFTVPVIMMDNKVCNATICNKISYDSGILKFSVKHFTVYSAEEEAVANASSSAGGSSGSSGGSGAAGEVLTGETPVEATPIENAENSGSVVDQPLFDIKLTIDENSKEVSGNDKVLATVELTNFGNTGSVSVDLSYSIINENGTYLEESESVNVEVQNEFIKEFNLKDLSKGQYKLKADLSYGDEKVSAEDTFSVSRESLKWYIKTMILFVISLAGAVGFYFYKFKKNKEEII